MTLVLHDPVRQGAVGHNGPAPGLVLCIGLSTEVVTTVVKSVGAGATVLIAADAGAAAHALFGQQDGTATGLTPGRPPAPRKPVEFGPLRLDTDAREATWRGRPVGLSARQFDLLATLAGDSARVWSFADLTETVWRRPYVGDMDALASAIKRLRRQLADVTGELIVTSVRGVGYRLVLVPTPLATPAVRRVKPTAQAVG